MRGAEDTEMWKGVERNTEESREGHTDTIGIKERNTKVRD
jgi:hypothetical protein